MWLNLEARTGLFVNQILTNNTLLNRKRNIRKRKTPMKYSCTNNIDERISFTEHLNILNEYQDELKYVTQNQKGSELDNSQSMKDSSTRDTDIVICVESHSPNQEKSEESGGNEFKKFKFQSDKNCENKGNIFNLLNIKNSLINKINPNFKKVSNLVDISSNESKKGESYYYINDKDKDKISFENIKKSLNSDDNESYIIKNLINKFYHFNFNSSSITKLVEKLNNFLINKNSAENKFQNNIIKIEINNEGSDKINSRGKKDSSYSNTLIEKMNNINNYKSALSLSTDQDYFNSIKYISNKIISHGDIIENNLMKALHESNKLIKEFQTINKESGEKHDLNILNDLLKNKQLRKKFKSNFEFLKGISEKKFYEFLNENNEIHKPELLINKKGKNINMSLLLDKNEKYEFFIFVYFLLGINYIEKSNLNLSESDLLSLIPYFIQENIPNKRKHRIFKKMKSKTIKLKSKKEPKKGNNIIRLNLEEIFDNTSPNDNCLTLIENNQK